MAFTGKGTGGLRATLARVGAELVATDLDETLVADAEVVGHLV
jgi:2-polyprenyl-3-methyl-5-hydroxy-6-metoxy-1,4-benzoquinol methylase